MVASFHQIFRDKKTFEIVFFRFIGTGNEVDSPVTCEAKQKSHITLLPRVNFQKNFQTAQIHYKDLLLFCDIGALDKKVDTKSPLTVN